MLCIRSLRSLKPVKFTKTSCFSAFHNSSSCTCSACSLAQPRIQKIDSFTYSQHSNMSTFSSFANRSPSVQEDDVHVQNILDNNKRWVANKNIHEPGFFRRVQDNVVAPKYLFFGCSEGGMSVNKLLNAKVGEVCIHLNFGNLIVCNDLNANSTLEYAVNILNVSDIIVCGHYGCGAVKAATTRMDEGTLENWLRGIRDVYRMHRNVLDLIKDPSTRQNTLVELTVVEQCLNIYKTGIVQRKRLQIQSELNYKSNCLIDCESGRDVTPRIHALVFDSTTGQLKKLPIDFGRSVNDLDHMYELSDTVE